MSRLCVRVSWCCVRAVGVLVLLLLLLVMWWGVFQDKHFEAFQKAAHSILADFEPVVNVFADAVMFFGEARRVLLDIAKNSCQFSVRRCTVWHAQPYCCCCPLLFLFLIPCCFCCAPLCSASSPPTLCWLFPSWNSLNDTSSSIYSWKPFTTGKWWSACLARRGRC